MLSKTIFLHNSLADWLSAVGIALIIFAAALLARRVSRQKLAILADKTVTAWDDLLVELVGRLYGFFFLAVAGYLGSMKLFIPEPTGTIFSHAVAVIVLIQLAVLSTHTVSFWVAHIRRQKIASDAGTVTTLTSVGFALRMLIWILLILIVLDNLGVDITALVAGLGITGIAVAMAMQNILGDLFASFSIVLDKPFVIGDFIVIDDCMGTVEHIGLKTTRVRSLSGEQLIFSNADLLKSRIRNYKRMYERRVVFSLGLVYRTPPEKLSQVPDIIRNAVEKHPQARFERAHFNEYGESALKFETVYWIANPDYNSYMDIHQAINLDIYRQFVEAEIEFAYPTQTVIVERKSGATQSFPC
ncbi:mechanosensitive ion channel family protein [Desulfoprunum benzoelyticum]|uniref:Small-conductance mechanosensitive channel n=1 Tax=Desulfoprunum benzoelyticum TaxID=1506996 RepID=A0A840V1E2_9BACT|nr:mechanosensitive ion channel family protein [Desulfoprunum benzoelyticum]MBB5348678.1 small-conductance mechanosensitive channel [Desulfoprunum benzoelyticum]MBM9530043.1 mechanosensitive ion channel family protein [Desulfoprunum benzoelyticum]